MIYTPINGYFDLTEKPKGMSVAAHKKIQSQQMIVIAEIEKYKDPEIRKNNPIPYNQIREIAARLQQIILDNWPHEMLFK